MKRKLVESKEEWENARDKKGLEQLFEIGRFFDRGVGQKAQGEEIENAEEFLQ